MDAILNGQIVDRAIERLTANMQEKSPDLREVTMIGRLAGLITFLAVSGHIDVEGMEVISRFENKAV